eukprot:1926750-Rhodomonas_salina.3
MGARTEAAPEINVQAGLDGATSIPAPRVWSRFKSQRRTHSSLGVTPRSADAHCDMTSSSLATQPDTAIRAAARPFGDGGPTGRNEKLVAVAVRSKTARDATPAPALAAETDAPMPVSDARVLCSMAATTLPPAATTSQLVATTAFRTPAPAPLCTTPSASASRDRTRPDAREEISCLGVEKGLVLSVVAVQDGSHLHWLATPLVDFRLSDRTFVLPLLHLLHRLVADPRRTSA